MQNSLRISTSCRAKPFPPAVEATLQDFIPPVAEVELDPTPLHRPHALSTQMQDTVHPNWCVRGIIYLVAFLHTRHHVTFRACALILSCLNLVLGALPVKLLGNSRMPLTLKTLFAQLGARDRFTVHPVCYNCHKVFLPGTDSDTVCPTCELELFRPATRRLFDALDDVRPIQSDSADSDNPDDDPPARVKREPHMVAPIQLLSVALQSSGILRSAWDGFCG